MKGERAQEECLTKDEGVAMFWVLGNQIYTFTPIKTGYIGNPLEVILTKEN
jgi:hypothetical protein